MAFAITATCVVPERLNHDAATGLEENVVVEEDFDSEEAVKGAWKVRRHDTRHDSRSGFAIVV